MGLGYRKNDQYLNVDLARIPRNDHPLGRGPQFFQYETGIARLAKLLKQFRLATHSCRKICVEDAKPWPVSHTPDAKYEYTSGKPPLSYLTSNYA